MRGVGFTVEQRSVGNGHDPSVEIHSKTATCIIGKGVGDSIGRCIIIGCGSGDADRSPIGCVFIDSVGVALVSLTVPTSNSSTSLMPMEKFWSV